MTVLEDTLPGSYAGVDFLVLASSISGGQKDVLKEFPNSNLQTVEQLGLKPRDYSLTIVVNADEQGNNYAQRRNNLLRVLEKGGNDILIHPLYGRLSDIVVRTFTVDENFSDLGAALFNVNFALNTTLGTPIVSGDTLSLVTTSSDQAIINIRTDFANLYSVSNNSPSNFENALNKINEIALAFRNFTTFLAVSSTESILASTGGVTSIVSAAGIDTFLNQLDEFENNATALVTQPANLSQSITDLFSTVNTLYDNPDSTFEVVQQFFNFGFENDETPIVENTAQRIERARNQSLLNNIIRAEALCLNYVNASQIDFVTINELNQIATILENQYNVVLNGVTEEATQNLSSSSSSPFEPNTLTSITDLRVQVQSFFAEQQLNVSQIISIRTNIQPARQLAYQYYGNSNRGFDIANLNEDQNVSFIEGNINIFSE